MADDKTGLNFAELLDDLLAASMEAEGHDDADSSSPSLRIDLLAQIERLQSGSRPHSTAQAIREYSANAAAPTARPPSAAPDLQPALDDLFFLDPHTISSELGLAGKQPDELDRARRSFAMRYHPDRVPEEMRERAMLRMQIANMLIDEAKRRKR